MTLQVQLKRVDRIYRSGVRGARAAEARGAALLCCARCGRAHGRDRCQIRACVPACIAPPHHARTHAHAQERLTGVVVVDAPSSISHTGINLTATGVVKPQLSGRSVGIFEAFTASIKPVDLLSLEIEIAKAGRLPAGRTEMPFEFEVEPVAGQVGGGACRGARD